MQALHARRLLTVRHCRWVTTITIIRIPTIKPIIDAVSDIEKLIMKKSSVGIITKYLVFVKIFEYNLRKSWL